MPPTSLRQPGLDPDRDLLENEAADLLAEAERLGAITSVEGAPGGDPGSIPSRHVGQPACVIGAGPSLEGFDFARCGNAVTIAVNAMGLRLRDADYLCFVDLSAYNSGALWLLINTGFRGEVVGPRGAAQRFARPITEFCHDSKARELHFHWPNLNLGHPTSAGLACALAFVMGCAPVYMLGIDYRIGCAGQTHAHAGGRRYTPADLSGLRGKHLETLEALRRAGAELINVTPHEPDEIGNAQPYSALGWQPVEDLSRFDLRRTT